MLQLKVFKGPTQSGKIFALESGRSLILGRGNDADIRLKGPGVSKQHCRLTVLPGSKLEIEDLGSANGTSVNGVLIKKYILRVGDTITIHDFILQLSMNAPTAMEAPARQQRSQPTPSFAQNFDGGAALQMDYSQISQQQGQAYAQARPAPSQEEIADSEPLTFRDKIYQWLEANVFPWADRLSSQIDVRTLMVMFFLLWSALMVGFTAMPFMEKANGRVRDQSIEVARLYVRQLVRLNQQAIVDRRYQDLIGSLDSTAGATAGVMQSMILDAEKAQILAPEGMLRQPLPDVYAKKAIALDKENWEIDADGVAYVSAPIWVGTSDGTNKVAATAYVVFNTLRNQFTMSSMVDQAITSLLYSMLVSFLFLIFVYRWTEGSILQVSERIDIAMKKQDPTVTSPVRWGAITALCEQVSSALGRAGNGGGRGATAQNFSLNEGEWAKAAVTVAAAAAASFDSNLRVTAWNDKMVRLIGIQASTAVGAEISDASRDIAFETAIRELCAECAAAPWATQIRDLEFAGVPNRISMVFGDSAYFVSIGGEG